MHIKLLSADLIEQIAAGEMILRPSMAVKELLENSIDAQSSSVEVCVEQGGLKAIEVCDNGNGISADDLPLAIARHATSKLSALDDLTRLNTYGFRGEALSSLAAISRLQIFSRTVSGESAYCLCQDSRKNWQIFPDSHPVGTTVKAEALFYNTPARKKFMSTVQTEWLQVDRVFKQAALAYPTIHFSLKHNGKRMRVYPYQMGQAVDPKITRIGQVFGKAFMEKSIYFSSSLTDDLKIEGWVAQAASTTQMLFVNRRCIRDKMLVHAVKGSFLKAMMGSHLPQIAASGSETLAILLFLDIPPDQIDINVHPAKEEVNFQDRRRVHDRIWHAVQLGFRAFFAKHSEPISTAASIRAAEGSLFPEPLTTDRNLTKEEAPFPFSDRRDLKPLHSSHNLIGNAVQSSDQLIGHPKAKPNYEAQWSAFSRLESQSPAKPILAVTHSLREASDEDDPVPNSDFLSSNAPEKRDSNVFPCILGRFVTLHQGRYVILLKAEKLWLYDYLDLETAYQAHRMETGAVASVKLSSALLIDWAGLMKRSSSGDPIADLRLASKAWFLRGFDWEWLGCLSLLRAVPAIWSHLDWQSVWPKFLAVFGGQFDQADTLCWKPMIREFLGHHQPTVVDCIRRLSEIERQACPETLQQLLSPLGRSVSLDELIARHFASPLNPIEAKEIR